MKSKYQQLKFKHIAGLTRLVVVNAPINLELPGREYVEPET
jgi:hypothetical protein